VERRFPKTPSSRMTWKTGLWSGTKKSEGLY
jgi:hypothetical protein